MPLPGQVAANSTIPFGGRTLDQATWVTGAAQKLLNGIVNQALTLGDASRVGMPASWPYGPIQNEDILAGGKASPILEAKVQNFVNSQGAQADPDFNSWVGVDFSTAAPGGWMDEPLTPAEKLAREQFEYTKQQNALKMALGGSSSSGSKISSSSTRSSSSGGGGSTSNYADDLAYLQAKTDATASLAQQEFDLKKQLMLLQFDLDNDPNNPKLLLQQQQLAEEKRQFDATLSRLSKSDQDALQLQRAKIISDYGANPGDAVAREYFLRQGVNPVGNAINIFTGQPTGQQMTLSEVMEANAPIVSGSLQGQMSGAPAPTTPTPEPTTPPPPEPPPPPEEEVPQFAMGTRPANPQLTRDGWTRAPEFISGDPQMMGRPNPEHVKLRVRNGRPEAKVTPLSQMLSGRGNRRMPQFADGTDPWAWQGTDWNQASGGSIESSDFNPDNLAQPQAGAYQPSTAPALNINWTEPYIVQQNSGTPMTASAAAADPYYGTAYQGMSPDQVVTNANSQYYGMTAEDAFIADQRHAEIMNAYGPGTLDALGQVTGKAPMTVVGPTAGMTTGGWLGGEPYNDPAYYSWSGDTGTERPTINVNTQGEAGILTGAQLSNGATQSVNPGAPGYVSSLPPPSTQPTGNLENDNILREATLGPDGKWYPKDQMPLPQGAATGSGTQSPITAPTAQMKDGATWNLLPGDIPNPTGAGYLRYDPTIKDYRPIQPKLTVIESEDQFWNLPPDVQQKILTGQPTGYVLAQQPGSQWRDGLLAGLGQPGSQGGTMRPEAFMALSDEEKMRLIGNPQWQMGSSLPGQQAYVPDTGALAGSWDGLLRLNNPQGAMSAGQTDYGTALLNSNESEYNRLMNPLPINFFGPDSPSVIDEPSSTTTTTGTTGTTGTTDTTGTTGTTGTTDTTGTTGTTGTGTGTGTALDPTLQALAALLGLSYGNQTYQNLPALQYALGNLTGGDYGNISNEPIEVPGLGLSLPGASSMMNYEMLQNLIQNGSFDLLNSLYTAGNVPLSLILKIAQARAPLGNAYDAGMIETV